jgi:hypothetical protein
MPENGKWNLTGRVLLLLLLLLLFTTNGLSPGGSDYFTRIS